MEPGSIYIALDKISLSRLDIRPVYDPKSRCYYGKNGNEYRYLNPGDPVICVEINPATGSVKVIYGDFIGWADSFYLNRFRLADDLDKDLMVG